MRRISLFFLRRTSVKTPKAERNLKRKQCLCLSFPSNCALFSISRVQRNNMAVLGVGVLLLTKYILGVYASYHWKVTENGRISSQVENSGFPLRKQDDLLALLEQEHRLQTMSRLYKELMLLKKSIDGRWARIEREGDFEKRLYTSDIDCLLGEVPFSQHNLNTEFLDYGQGSRPKMKNDFDVQPDCTVYSKLDFSMRTFPHLETLNKRTDSNLIVNPVPSKTVIDFDIDAMLRLNSSDWTAYNIASFYWRTVGNGTNALECAKRALYFSPRNQRYLVLLNLGTLLQELQSLGEAAIVLHSAVDHDPVQDVSHLALGNVYAALGDYNRSLVCYENVLSLNPENVRALRLKHALLCHKKLESGLLEIHFSLQKILEDLHHHNSMHEECLHLQSQVNWEQDSKAKGFFSPPQPLYLNLWMLLQNVERQARTVNEKVSKKVPMKRSGNLIPMNGAERKPVGRASGGKIVLDSYEDDAEKRDYDESQLKNVVTSRYLFTNKINSLITSIKSNYEEEINLMEFRRKMSEEFNFLNKKMHFSLEEPYLFTDIDSCVKDSSDVKKLN